MAVAFRSSQSVTNGTAGTTVVVTKPAGIVDTGSNPARDQLIAMIACTGAPTITAPAGWTLVQTIVSTTAVTLACYRKLASSEGASWTWTLGTSQRNWGWVGAYTGVDPTTPISFSATIAAMSTTTTLLGGQVIRPGEIEIVAGAATRAATGVATTWTETGATVTPTERADLSTNAGAGTDITGVVVDDTWSASYADLSDPVLTASQAQTVGVAIDLNLRPYFTPYTGGKLTGLIVEAAFGADISTDQSTWTWTAVRVHHPSDVTITVGRSNGTSRADPSRISFSVLNLSGEWTSPTGAYSQYLVRNLPFRVRINSIGTGHTGGYQRGTAFLASAKPRWASDGSTKFSVVDIVAQGQLRRFQQGLKPAHSAAYRSLIGTGPNTFTPIAYWPFEDESGATAANSPIPGCDPSATASVTFGSSTIFPGSAAVARLSAASTVVGKVPVYATTAMWAVVVGLSIPVEPAAGTCVIQVATTGTAWAWQITITPGTTTMDVRAWDSTGLVLTASVNLTEADVYGQPTYWSLDVSQVGADINYQAFCYTPNGGAGKIGTLAAHTAGQVVNYSIPAQAGLANAALGHVAVYADADFDPDVQIGSFQQVAILTGNSGEHPWSRFQRLTDEDGIDSTFTQSENSDLTMGPQGVATLIDLLRECETVEGNLMHDIGSLTLNPETGLLSFPARDERDNRAADLTLDIDLRHIQPGFEPALDDLTIRNDVEVSRTGGSSARVTDEASIAREGLYRDQVTVNTLNDLYLGDLAGIRVAAGTVTGMRFPNVEWDLRSTPDLAETWLACRLGARVDITHPPSQYPPDAIRSFLEGYTETLSTTKWRVRANLSPASANRVFLLAADAADTGEYVGRLEPDTCNLLVAVNSSATSWTVFTDPAWTTVADDFPCTVRKAGEVVTLTAVASCATDSFTRTVVNGWGSATTGQTYLNDYTDADGDVGGTTGTIQPTSLASDYDTWFDIFSANVDLKADFQLNTLPATNAMRFGLIGRVTDGDNNYRGEVSVSTAGVMTLQLVKKVATVVTVLTSITMGGVLATATSYTIRLRVVGSLLRLRMWKTSDTEPEWWVEWTDTALTTGTSAGVFVRNDSALTTRIVTIDNLDVSEPKTWTVTRAVNTVAKAQTTGAITIDQPNLLGM